MSMPLVNLYLDCKCWHHAVHPMSIPQYQYELTICRWQGLAHTYPQQLALEDPHRPYPQSALSPPEAAEQSSGSSGGPAATTVIEAAPPSGICLTFSQLWEQMMAFAAGLYGVGLRPGERVSLFSENSCRWLVADQVSEEFSVCGVSSMLLFRSRVTRELM